MEKYSDEEIKYLLDHPIFGKIRIDNDVDQFWDVNRQWVPAGYHKKESRYAPIKDALDKVFSRYTLGIIGQGLKTEDYWVIDTKNPYFDASLSEFLELYKGNRLPVDMTKHQLHLQKVKEISLWIGGSLMLVFIFWVLLSIILHPIAGVFPHNVGLK